jgi:hypothetical protein
MKQLTEAEKQATDETRELLVSLDEKQKELTEYPIKCSMSVNIVDVFTFFIISSMIVTFLQSL